MAKIGLYLTYTDASRDPVKNKSAIGTYIPSTSDRYSAVLPPNTQIYTAEIMAIKNACHYIRNNHIRPILIRSDSKTALKMIRAGKISDKSLYVTIYTRKLNLYY